MQSATAIYPSLTHDPVVRFNPRWVPWLRVIWALVTLNAVAVFALMVNLTRNFADHLPVRIASGLSALGWTNDHYFWFHLGFMALTFVCFFAIGILIFLLRPRERMAWLASILLITFGAEISYPAATEFAASWANAPALFGPTYFMNNIFSWGLLAAFLALFPDGRFVPQWSRYLALFGLCFSLAFSLFPSQLISAEGGLLFVVLTGAVILFGGSLYAQAWRYQRHSTPLQKQQTKWLIYGLALIVFFVFVVTMGIYVFLPILQVGAATAVTVDFVYFLSNLSFLFLPLAIGVAIVRYRLWDIEILIRRTLVYVPLTAILAGIFAASITLTQKLFVSMTGSQSDAAAVLTTLIVVAAFEPVKAWLQKIVDRRFKEAPDPRKRMRAFRDEVIKEMGVIDTRRMIRRLLGEAVDAFEASGGVAFLGDGAGAEPALTCGAWQGDAALRVALASNGAQVGQVALGARKNGLEYSEGDRAALTETARIVAEAIQGDPLV